MKVILIVAALSSAALLLIMGIVGGMFYGIAAGGVSRGFWLSSVMLELAWEGQIIDWTLMKISPFAHTHYTIDIANLPLVPLFFLICIFAVLTVIGFWGFRNRNVLTKA